MCKYECLKGNYNKICLYIVVFSERSAEDIKSCLEDHFVPNKTLLLSELQNNEIIKVSKYVVLSINTLG